LVPHSTLKFDVLIINFDGHDFILRFSFGRLKGFLNFVAEIPEDAHKKKLGDDAAEVVEDAECIHVWGDVMVIGKPHLHTEASEEDECREHVQAEGSRMPQKHGCVNKVYRFSLDEVVPDLNNTLN
jgi:hypothetical protein